MSNPTDPISATAATDLPALAYAPPDRGEVPNVVPQVEAAIDEGRSLRPLGGLFPSAQASAIYVSGALQRRLAILALSSRDCIACGRPTDSTIQCVWQFSVPRHRWLALFPELAEPGPLWSFHPCCRDCAARFERRRRWQGRISGSLTVAGLGVIGIAVYSAVEFGKRHRIPSAFFFAPLAACVLFALLGWLLFRQYRRSLPQGFRDRVPRALRFHGWGLTSTRPSGRTERSAPPDWVQLAAARISAAAVIAHVTDPAAGGVDVFLGTTRSETRADGVELLALDYEAYAEMAEAQMRELLVAARARWPIVRAAILHRVGRVGLGEASVVIAVSCPHRAAAFESCRFLIDELKKSVAIWKKECWADGSMSWIHPDSGVVTVERSQAR